jgi:outer membrane receptor protein involved in Fe transport
MVTRRLTLLLLTGVLVLLPITAAQAQTTGGLRGQVLDKDGQPLPTARVLITNPTLGVQQAAVADAKGEFRVVPLPPGKGYSVRVEFPGMSTVTLSDIEVAPGKVVAVPVTLRPDKEMQEKIRVTATTEVVNTESTTTQTNISSEFIDALPILGRNYQDVLTLAPGVSDVDGDGNPNIHGARDTDTVTLVDGVSTVDPVTGRVGQQLNINSIQEIEVKTSGASAEFGRAQGGFVTIVTKSGGNDFEGLFRFDWRGHALDGDGAGIDPPQLHGGLGEIGLRNLNFNDLYPQLTVSGPIVKDKAWYFVALEFRQEQTPVNALTQAFVRTVRQDRLFGKATWQMSTNHKLVFTATFDPQTFENLGLSSFTALEAGYTQKLGGRNLVLRETAVFSPNVFLDSTIQDFISYPQQIPTLNADTNGNGILYIDRNHNNFIDATERDPGEDFDRDGKFDVFEDTIRKNNVLDPGEDRDGDGRLTQSGHLLNPGGCEGVNREDKDCDGWPDRIDEDPNNNGRCDPGEPCDVDNDGLLEHEIMTDPNHNGIPCELGEPCGEDRNGDFVIDDRPVLSPDDHIPDPNGNINTWYPYGEQFPLSRDRDYETDQRTLRTTGPYLSDFTGNRGRQTIKEDLTIFVPDWHGQHELKTGVIVEKETYSQDTNLRPYVLPNLSPPTANSFVPTVGVILPAENNVSNSATSLTGAIYVQDTYKPLPNLTLNLGLRFDREATDSFGYTPFDPRQERALFDRLNGLAGGEIPLTDATTGNNDHIDEKGYCFDPLFQGLGGTTCGTTGIASPFLTDLSSTLYKARLSRLTEHHTATNLVAQTLATLFPGASDPNTGIVDRDLLRQQGAVFQEEAPFRLTNNNLSPRLAVSWDPWADSKTKIFASWSRFYDKLFLNTVIPEEGPDTIARYYRKDPDGITASGVPDNGFGDPISKAPPSTAQVDRGLQTPFTDEWSIGFERELAPEISIRMSYINRSGRLGVQFHDINHEVRYNPTNGKVLDQIGKLVVGSGAGAGGTPTPDNIPDLYIYNFFFNEIYRLSNYSSSEYHGIEVQVTKRLSRKWQMDASYTYSRAQGDAETVGGGTLGLGLDPATLQYEYGYLNFDQRHVVRLNGTTFLPNDWTMGGILQWTSGLPYSVLTNAFSLDNFQYAQNRVLFGQVANNTSGGVFTPERRDSRRNASVLNINLQATKAFVIGRFNSKLFLTVDNLLNKDDLTINNYYPAAPNRAGALQLDAERRFGRRYSIGFQFEF